MSHPRGFVFIEAVIVLATLPALGVGAAAYSFNFDAIQLLTWLFGGDAHQLWRYFWFYVAAIVFVWMAFIAIWLRLDRRG